MPHIPLLPTGGVDAANAGEWIRAGAVALGVGGKLVDRAAIKAGDWDTYGPRPGTHGRRAQRPRGMIQIGHGITTERHEEMVARANPERSATG